MVILGAPPGCFFIEFQRVTVSNPESSDTHFFHSFSGAGHPHRLRDHLARCGARSIGADTQGEAALLEPLHLKEVNSNIAPSRTARPS